MQLRLFKEGDTEDWVIIEMQGDLESRVGETDMASKFIGDLHYSKDNGAPILIIGHHILHGKVVEMARPFVAMEKRRTGRSRQDGRNEASPTGTAGDEGCDEVSYRVKAVVRKKIVFKTRPKPIIANVPKKV